MGKTKLMGLVLFFLQWALTSFDGKNIKVLRDPKQAKNCKLPISFYSNLCTKMATALNMN